MSKYEDYGAPYDDDRYHLDVQDGDKVKRRLQQRHVQMIAIAGTIGTGLFLASGTVLERAGPLGALMAYAFIGTVAYSSLCAVGEMTCFAPVSGTFPHFASRWVDPAFGFAVGWNYFYTQAITIPAEVTAAQMLLTFWDRNPNHSSLYTALILVFMCSINLFGVRWFGETEFFFSVIKLALITGLILFGLIVDLGGGPDHDVIGFRYWKNPGALNTYLVHSPESTGHFLALLSTLVLAAFSFQGMELVAIAASETESPRRNIAKAVRWVFYRIIVFYILGVIVTGMIIPSNDPRLLRDSGLSGEKSELPATNVTEIGPKGTAAQSPYVIAMQIAGVKGLPHLVNAAVFTSAFSAGSSYLFTSSRVLYGLALRGQAPRVFAHCTNDGLPIVAVGVSALFSLLSFMNVSAKYASHVFTWLAHLAAVGGFFTWLSINLTYIRFHAGLRRRGVDRTKFIYYSSLQPYLSYWGVFWSAFCILINGFPIFWNFKASLFCFAYLNIPIFLSLYIGYKWRTGSQIWSTTQMDFIRGIPTIEETERPPVPPRTILGKVLQFLF